jgi:hypothetical protein
MTFLFFGSIDILSFIEYSGFGEIYKHSNMPREDMILTELTQPLQENLQSSVLHVPTRRRTCQQTGKMLHFPYG